MVQVDLSQSITKSIIVDISDPDNNDYISLINVTVSGTSNYFISPSSPTLLQQSSTFTINFTPARGEYPVFK